MNNSKTSSSQAKGVHITPRKSRLVLRAIKGKNVMQAQKMLAFSPLKASKIVNSVLKSAVANATHGKGLTADKLVVVNAYSDPGRVMKRFRPGSHGEAHRILKRTSHITIKVQEMEVK